MRIAMTGRGTSGSWQIRGVQLGSAIGADLKPNVVFTSAFREYDTVIVVKRITEANLRAVQASKRRIIWDVVDAWPQPEGNGWHREQCLVWLQNELDRIKPDGIIAATERMKRDLHDMMSVPVLYLPHHSDPKLQPQVVARTVERIGYEGAPHYLGRWREVAQTWCKRNQVQWAENPGSISKLDIVLALRDSYGFAPKHWKSNVKLTNAHAAGIPCICSPEQGYIDVQTLAESWVDTPDAPHALWQALDALLPFERRLEVFDHFTSNAMYFTLDAVSKRLKQWLSTK